SVRKLLQLELRAPAMRRVVHHLHQLPPLLLTEDPVRAKRLVPQRRTAFNRQLLRAHIQASHCDSSPLLSTILVLHKLKTFFPGRPQPLEVVSRSPLSGANSKPGARSAGRILIVPILFRSGGVCVRGEEPGERAENVPV